MEVLPRYFFFVPEALAQAIDESASLFRSAKAAVALACVAVVTSLPIFLRDADSVYYVDWSLPVYAGQTLLLLRALQLESSEAWRRLHLQHVPPPVDPGRGLKAVRWGWTAWMVTYTFVLPVLGLVDMPYLSPYGQGRMHVSALGLEP